MGTVEVQKREVGNVEQQPCRKLEQVDAEVAQNVYTVARTRAFAEGWNEMG